MASNYIPDELLPIFPTFSTVVKDGVKYKAYFETDWHQVMTEDGVPLCELLQSLPTYEESNFYRYKGTLKDKPGSTAMEQLYAISDQKIGDVWLVETPMVVEVSKNYEIVCEAYVWLGTSWVYSGTTNKQATVQANLPNVLKLFPEELGEPNQTIVIGEDGKSITWGNIENIALDNHNTDINAHQDIRKSIDLKADRLIIFEDVLKTSGWSYNDDYPCFEYVYSSVKMPIGAYFEITPVVSTKEHTEVITKAAISPVFEIITSQQYAPYATIRASHVPTADIPICVKVYGAFSEK